jgi:hypothetical protein
LTNASSVTETRSPRFSPCAPTSTPAGSPNAPAVGRRGRPAWARRRRSERESRTNRSWYKGTGERLGRPRCCRIRSTTRVLARRGRRPAATLPCGRAALHRLGAGRRSTPDRGFSPKPLHAARPRPLSRHSASLEDRCRKHRIVTLGAASSCRKREAAPCASRTGSLRSHLSSLGAPSLRGLGIGYIHWVGVAPYWRFLFLRRSLALVLAALLRSPFPAVDQQSSKGDGREPFDRTTRPQPGAVP